MSERRYISVVETAKLLRVALKAKFPGVKFSVRSDSYASGASIDVGYVDGPRVKEVEAVVGPFKGAGFDGMIDLKYYNTSYILPDGKVVNGNCEGTVGSRGTVSPEHNPKPEGAVEVRFGADFIFVRQKHSVEATIKALKEVAAKYGYPEWANLEIDGSDRDNAYIRNGQNIYMKGGEGSYESCVQSLVYRHWSEEPEKESA